MVGVGVGVGVRVTRTNAFVFADNSSQPVFDPSLDVLTYKYEPVLN